MTTSNYFINVRPQNYQFVELGVDIDIAIEDGKVVERGSAGYFSTRLNFAESIDEKSFLEFMHSNAYDKKFEEVKDLLTMYLNLHGYTEVEYIVMFGPDTGKKL